MFSGAKEHGGMELPEIGTSPQIWENPLPRIYWWLVHFVSVGWSLAVPLNNHPGLTGETKYSHWNFCDYWKAPQNQPSCTKIVMLTVLVTGVWNVCHFFAFWFGVGGFLPICLIYDELVRCEKPYRGKRKRIGCPGLLSMRAKVKGQVTENISRKKKRERENNLAL